MKIVLTFIVLILGQSLWASEEDSSSIDTNYRLYDVQREKMVDTSVQIQLVNSEDLVKDYWDDRIVSPITEGPIPLGGNYDSIHNINPKVAGFISVCFLSFIAYIIFRVRRSLKKDKRNASQ